VRKLLAVVVAFPLVGMVAGCGSSSSSNTGTGPPELTGDAIVCHAAYAFNNVPVPVGGEAGLVNEESFVSSLKNATTKRIENPAIRSQVDQIVRGNHVYSGDELTNQAKGLSGPCQKLGYKEFSP
jgi:hypothetical protein